MAGTAFCEYKALTADVPGWEVVVDHVEVLRQDSTDRAQVGYLYTEINPEYPDEPSRNCNDYVVVRQDGGWVVDDVIHRLDEGALCRDVLEADL